MATVIVRLGGEHVPLTETGLANVWLCVGKVMLTNSRLSGMQLSSRMGLGRGQLSPTRGSILTLRKEAVQLSTKKPRPERAANGGAGSFGVKPIC